MSTFPIEVSSQMWLAELSMERLGRDLRANGIEVVRIRPDDEERWVKLWLRVEASSSDEAIRVVETLLTATSPSGPGAGWKVESGAGYLGESAT